MRGWVKVLLRRWKDLTNTRKLRRRVRELEQECVWLMYRLSCADEIERLIDNDKFTALLDAEQKNELAAELLRRLGILGQDE